MKASCRWFGAAAIIPTKTVLAGLARIGVCRVASAFIRDAAGLAYIDDQGRLFPLLEVDEDDEEPVLFESEQIWFSKEPGRALCHCFAERFDSVAFCAFGGRGRRFGRRLYPLPAAGGGGRRQRQPPAFRLSRWPVCRNTSSTATAGCSHWTSAMWRTSNIITTTTTS